MLFDITNTVININQGKVSRIVNLRKRCGVGASLTTTRVSHVFYNTLFFLEVDGASIVEELAGKVVVLGSFFGENHHLAFRWRAGGCHAGFHALTV